MIFVRDRGRMCNNILQYGHVYAWAREHDRSVMSMRFSYKYQYFKICHSPRHNFAFYLTAKFLNKIGILPAVSYMLPADEGNCQLEEYMLHHTNYIVEGWFVRFYDLFLKYKDEITDLFDFDSRIKEKVKTTIDRNSNEGDIRLGIHVRHGDYKTFNGGAFYYDDDVYISHIKAFVRKNSSKHVTVFICSNDPKIDRENYTKNLPEASVVFPDGNPGEDLCLLSECDYLIGPPSTFTLVASMYRDTPLLWMHSTDSDNVNNTDCWGHFDKLFQEIL